MSKFELWFLKRVIAKEVRQNFDHAEKVKNLYSLIRRACEDEFYEDNPPTISSFLSDCFEQKQEWSWRTAS
jgi:hypothetical protein